MSEPKTCLVISPVGEEGSETRVKADDLLENVLRPAAEGRGYTVVRADQLPTPGQITPQLAKLLVEADLVLADLTEHNPNVLYELAVRHASAKPCVQLMGGDGELPFDVKDFRTIRLETPNYGAAKKAQDEIARQIEAAELEGAGTNAIADAFRPRSGPAEEDFKVFPAPRGREYNHEFYAYFTDRIRGARSAIYITGEGFACADDEGRKLARGFHDAFRDALAEGVHVVRIQTKERVSPLWSTLISELSEEYPDTFDVVTLAEHGTAQMSSVCVIDAEDDRECVVEIMLQTEKLFGITAADLAGTAVFVVGRQDLALDMRSRIRTLCKGQRYRYYFAYGSNVDEEQMKQRCPSAERMGVAALRDHKLVFNRRGSYRPGGVASVEPAEGERVYGVTWRVTASDLERLDETEDPAAYRRRDATVYGLDGSAQRACVYEAIPEGVFEPDEDYLGLLFAAASKAGLPKAYLDGLKAAAAEAD